ncbi:uncharacterized protein LOC143591112 [Bidens hawaiensis]|uniref:uncharacterized protein LOC143591112 n=1 Tax=Bidens hawaiensis TaxID=980011 RepID=UPI00404AD520
MEQPAGYALQESHMSSRSKKCSIKDSPSSNKKNHSNATDVRRLNKMIPLTNANTSQIGQEFQASASLSTFNATRQSSLVCFTRTLQGPLSNNQRFEMMFLDERQKTGTPQNTNQRQGIIYSAYLDHGDQNFMCGMCNALLWEAERKRGKTNNGITTYTLFCSYGCAQLPEMKDTKSNSEVLDNQIIHYLKVMLDSKNPLVKSYRMARDCFQQNPNVYLKFRIIGTRQTNARTYNLPTTSEVTTLIVGDIGEAIDKRYIIVTTQSGALQRISEVHPCYVPLQYPIFFPYGDDGYRIDIAHRELRGSTKRKRKKCQCVNPFHTVVYTIEFQKRGLPHAHICLFLHSEHKIHNLENINKFISAEIPDLNEDPELYSLVIDHMMHGPCGVANPKFSCMVDNSCSKKFPKKFQNETSIDSNGFPGYRKIDLGNVVVKPAVNLDNRHVVPYNNRLVPSVTRLPFHLPGQQKVVFADDDDVEDVLNKPSVGSSKFIAWMECNQQYGLARTLTYVEFPTKFVWKPVERVWDLSKRGFSIGRVHHFPPAFNETYYLRILLNKVKGPMCFEDIRTVDGEVCATYRDACYKRGLLDDDNEYIEAIEEASQTTSGYYLRSLFATMLITYSLSRPDDVWEKCRHYLIDGILYKQQNDQKNPDLVLSETQLKNLVLLEIKNFLLRNNCTLRCFPTMSFPDDDSILASTNCFMNEELAYDTEVITDGNRSNCQHPFGGKVIVFGGDF